MLDKIRNKIPTPEIPPFRIPSRIFTIPSTFISNYSMPTNGPRKVQFILHSIINPSYLLKLKKTDSPLCFCNSQIETVEHFLFHCNLFSHYRSSFKTYCIRYTKNGRHHSKKYRITTNYGLNLKNTSTKPKD